MQLGKTNEELNYKIERKKYIFLLAGGFTTLLIVVVISLIQGNFQTSVADVISAIMVPRKNEQIYTIIVYSRIPRLVASIFVGAALSVAGWVYQEVFSNRIVSPDVLGVSSGAGVGAALGFILECSIPMVGIMAFGSGIASVIIAILLTRLFGRGANKILSLVLSGIIVNGLMSSLLGLLKYISNDTQLTTITYWLLGGFYNVGYEELVIVVPLIGILLIFIYMLRWHIIMIKNGDIDAKTHGINYVVTRNVAVIIATIITALSVSISGTIGWIGLAVPNFVRIIIKNNEKRVFSLVVLYGMVFTGISDLLARRITKTEIPIGIITGLLGAMLFTGVLIVRRRNE